ncbi:MAG: peptide chain release factor N(5)-glutamine methyltransferase [Clostridia bacterium]|nr:peptide chain release factor N(5)-glutamine methyltransferase [Clostridia bacterium]
MAYSYQSLTQTLIDGGIDPADAKEEAILLLTAFAGADRVTLLCDRHKLYATPALMAAVGKRLTRYPLQYILGTWDFFGCTFKVDESCLIPRPDTELLVETAITALPKGGIFADLCTGSGCVAVAILKHRPDLTAVALELYPETLSLAVENAKLNGVAHRLIPLRADLLTEGREALAAYAPLCGIVSNPPYIPRVVVDGLAPELFYEPRAALDGGEDGLVFYRKILSDYTSLLAPNAPLMVEIGYDQGDALTALGKIYLPNIPAEIICDLGGNHRVAAFRHNADSNRIS